MGFKPMAPIEVGNCPGSGEDSSATAAFTRIFDIVWKLYIGLAGKRAIASAWPNRVFSVTRADSPHLCGEKWVASAVRGWQESQSGADSSLVKIMLRAAKFFVLGILAFAIWGQQPAAAGCEVVSATHSADSKQEALSMSRVLAAESAVEVRRKRGWSY